jgi:ABC-type branched-subunit amino acid transport system permease subunit
MVVLGGMGNVTGGILSALAVTSLPEALRFMTRSRMIVYALILLLMLRYTKVLDIENLKRLAQRMWRKTLTVTNHKDEVQG